MFSSFQTAAPAGGSTAGSSGETPVRPKRHQIRKACDNCRQARVKCDEIRPCRRCKDSGRKCGNETHNEFKELSPALREIEKLRRQVKDLESRLSSAESLVQRTSSASLSTNTSAGNITDTPLKIWRGVTINDLKYGQFSLEFLIHRLCQQFNDESPFLPVPIEPFLPLSSQPETMDMASRQPSRSQQEAFLESFWQGIHVLYPVIDETAFRARFAGLWDPGATVRRPDKLVDIVLAVCMQHSIENLMRANTDADAGAFFFARWKESFSRHDVDLEQVQSAIIAHVFLVGEWRIDEAMHTIGLAIRTAHMLGLHSGAFQASNTLLNELGRRTWLVLASVETGLSLRVDRTPLVPLKHVPRLTDQAGKLEANHSESGTTIHWLDFLNMRAELLVLAQTISIQFTAKCAVLDPTLTPQTPEDISTREELAEFALEAVAALKAWSSSVPPALHLARVDRSARSFSTQRSRPELTIQPLWLTRQQLALELLYHTSCLRLLRPFIGRGGPAWVASAPVADSAAIAAVNHAVIVAGLVAHSKTHDLLRGWRYFCNMFAESVWCCGAFATGHPLSAPATSARKTLSVAVAIDLKGIRERDEQAGCVGAGPRRKMSRKRVIRVVEWLLPRIAGAVGGYEAEAQARRTIEAQTLLGQMEDFRQPGDEGQLYIGLHEIVQTWMNDSLEQMWRGFDGNTRW